MGLRWLGKRQWYHGGRNVGSGESFPDRIVREDVQRPGQFKVLNPWNAAKEARWARIRETKLKELLIKAGRQDLAFEMDLIPTQQRDYIYKKFWRALLALRSNHEAFDPHPNRTEV